MMKIPEYIDRALWRRTKAAESFNTNDLIVSQWITKHGLDEAIETEDFYGGVESLVNPYDSEERIRKAITEKE